MYLQAANLFSYLTSWFSFFPCTEFLQVAQSAAQTMGRRNMLQI